MKGHKVIKIMIFASVIPNNPKSEEYHKDKKAKIKEQRIIENIQAIAPPLFFCISNK